MGIKKNPNQAGKQKHLCFTYLAKQVFHQKLQTMEAVDYNCTYKGLD